MIPALLAIVITLAGLAILGYVLWVIRDERRGSRCKDCGRRVDKLPHLPRCRWWGR